MAFAFNSKYDLLTHVRLEHAKGKISCVLVDEAQFLTKEQVMQLTMIVDQVGIPVVCYGLRTDFRGEPFEGSMYLLSWAEELTEIKAVCGCGRKATMNARIGTDGIRVVEGAQICIGHHYRAMARKCFDLTAVSPIKYTHPLVTSGATMAQLREATPCAKAMAAVKTGAGSQGKEILVGEDVVEPSKETSAGLGPLECKEAVVYN